MPSRKKNEKAEELSQEQYEEVMQSLEQFNNSFIQELIGTDKYEIVPTVTDSGKPLTKEQYTLIKNECSRLGVAVVYKIDMPNGTTLLWNNRTKKIGCIDEGMH
jgi:hypothetical protein